MIRPETRPALLIGGWVGTEFYLKGKTPAQMEKLFGFHVGYLAYGVTVFKFTRPIAADDFDLTGVYAYLPGGKAWNGIDLKWSLGEGTTQWQLEQGLSIPCRLLKIGGRGTAYA